VRDSEEDDSCSDEENNPAEVDDVSIVELGEETPERTPPRSPTGSISFGSAIAPDVPPTVERVSWHAPVEFPPRLGVADWLKRRSRPSSRAGKRALTITHQHRVKPPNPSVVSTQKRSRVRAKTGKKRVAAPSLSTRLLDRPNLRPRTSHACLVSNAVGAARAPSAAAVRVRGTSGTKVKRPIGEKWRKRRDNNQELCRENDRKKSGTEQSKATCKRKKGKKKKLRRIDVARMLDRLCTKERARPLTSHLRSGNASAKAAQAIRKRAKKKVVAVANPTRDGVSLQKPVARTLYARKRRLPRRKRKG
jgi:hypothetical protein